MGGRLTKLLKSPGALAAESSPGRLGALVREGKQGTNTLDRLKISHVDVVIFNLNRDVRASRLLDFPAAKL
jgi:hypothetical protein